MITFPNAKINLGLNIVEKRPDGYHNLETVFYPIPLEDALEIRSIEKSTSSKGDEKCFLHQFGLKIAQEPNNNLVVKAYKLLDEIYHLPPIETYLYKHIPFGAGLGGGSSDAASMLKLINNKFKLELTDTLLEEYASRIGADCAFFITNKPTYAEGIGNIFTAVPLSLKGYQLILVKPDIFVSTGKAFAHITPHQPENSLKKIIKLPVEEWKKHITNDFEKSVFPQFPLIGKIKEKLYQEGALYASMSGSGSSVFGLFAADFILPEIDFGKNSLTFSLKLE